VISRLNKKTKAIIILTSLQNIKIKTQTLTSIVIVTHQSVVAARQLVFAMMSIDFHDPI
jgi:hypothetical protein